MGWASSIAVGCLFAVSGLASAQESVQVVNASGLEDALAINGDRIVQTFAIGAGIPTQDEELQLIARIGGVWQQTATLFSPFGVLDADFGSDVAMGDGFLAVGASGYDAPGAVNGGLVQVYRIEGDGYVTEQQLWPIVDTGNNARFGNQLDADGSRLLVGSRSMGQPQGTVAHVFKRIGTGWLLEGILDAPAVQVGWGSSVALDDPWAFVGATDGGLGLTVTGPGAVHVYHRDGEDWSYHSTLDGAVLSPEGELGTDVSADGGWLAASQGQVDGDSRVGMYRLVDGAWFLDQVLTFGPFSVFLPRDVALEGDRLVVALPIRTEIWRRCDDAWVPEALFEPGGIGVATDGDRIVMQTGQATSSQSQVTIWEDPEPDLLFETVDAGSFGALGQPALSWVGLPCAGEPVSLSLSNAPPFAPAVLFLGEEVMLRPFLGGTLATKPLVVIGGLVTDATGGFSLLSVWPTGPASGVGIVLQSWVADVTGPQGAVGSNGLVGEVP